MPESEVFFHMDALPCAVPLRINFDLQLTRIANSLYGLSGQCVGEGLETARRDTLFHKLVRTSATINISQRSIEVRLRRRANNPFPLATNHARTPRACSDWCQRAGPVGPQCY